MKTSGLQRSLRRFRGVLYRLFVLRADRYWAGKR